MTRTAFARAAVAVLLVGLALALPAAADTPRFTLAPAASGVTLLDTQTGAVSHCAEAEGAWTCQTAAAAEPSRGPAARPSTSALHTFAAEATGRLVALAHRIKQRI